ncbi:hypothetical protein PRIPAC_70676 [Pristionchus pacificus]|uniref:Uncharacterized protein n=1 Tax=Pristionchus pacificus TaxID=54126 RepID=A0A2A6CS53_PRIPA|nr:hypothetical protein PRIPAC_70676 [Pristionchus pacificus]|eukprot:PDM80916.1 hypothetical protein PRIPAC_35919 [Pristionchus pacificus]
MSFAQLKSVIKSRFMEDSSMINDQPTPNKSLRSSATCPNFSFGGEPTRKIWMLLRFLALPPPSLLQSLLLLSLRRLQLPPRSIGEVESTISNWPSSLTPTATEVDTLSHFSIHSSPFVVSRMRPTGLLSCISPGYQRYVILPKQTPNSKEIACFGPVLVYYYASSSSNGAQMADANFGFQIVGSWVPMIFTTAAPFTRVICQGKTPLFIPAKVEVVVKEKGVKLYVMGEAQIVKMFKEEIKCEKSQEQIMLPGDGFCAMYTADPDEIDEDIVTIITADMTVYCAGRQTIKLHQEDTVVIMKDEE